MSSPPPRRPPPNPLKRSLTVPVPRPRPQTPGSKLPPANWGQALKAGLSDTVTHELSPESSEPPSQLSEASLRRRTTPPNLRHRTTSPKLEAFGPLQDAAAAIGVTPALASARRSEDRRSDASSVHHSDADTISERSFSATVESSPSRVLRPELASRHDEIDSFTQTLEDKLRRKGHRDISRDPEVEHDYRSGTFLESVATLRWWTLFCALFILLGIAYALGATEPIAHAPPPRHPPTPDPHSSSP